MPRQSAKGPDYKAVKKEVIKNEGRKAWREQKGEAKVSAGYKKTTFGMSGRPDTPLAPTKF